MNDFEVRKEFWIYIVPTLILVMIYAFLFQLKTTFYVMAMVYIVINIHVWKYKKIKKSGYLCLALALISGGIQFVNQYLLN